MAGNFGGDFQSFLGTGFVNFFFTFNLDNQLIQVTLLAYDNAILRFDFTNVE